MFICWPVIQLASNHGKNNMGIFRYLYRWSIRSPSKSLHQIVQLPPNNNHIAQLYHNYNLSALLSIQSILTPWHLSSFFSEEKIEKKMSSFLTWMFLGGPHQGSVQWIIFDESKRDWFMYFFVVMCVLAGNSERYVGCKSVGSCMLLVSFSPIYLANWTMYGNF